MATRVLVLPGIGDIYWVAVALKDFMAQRGLSTVEVHVWDFDGRRRSQEFVERIPFVTVGGYFNHPPHPHKQPEFRQSYLTGEASVFPGLYGFDYYIAVNGALRTGRTVEEALGCATDWYFPLRQTPAEQQAEADFKAKYGRYVVAHFSDFGMFKPWVKAWGLRGCVELVKRVALDSQAAVLLTGCEWDRPFSVEIARHARMAHCIAGQTGPDEFFGMLRGAAGVFGWCGGNTILATALRKPTLIGWSTYFQDPAFFRNSCPPDAYKAHYDICTVELDKPRTAALRFAALLKAAA